MEQEPTLEELARRFDVDLRSPEVITAELNGQVRRLRARVDQLEAENAEMRAVFDEVMRSVDATKGSPP